MDAIKEEKNQHAEQGDRCRERRKKRGEKIELDEDRLPSRAMAIHEHIRQDGEKELERDAMALFWSAIAAGLSMGASLLAKGIFTFSLMAYPAVSCWKTSVIPLVLSSSSWRASSCLPRTQ